MAKGDDPARLAISAAVGLTREARRLLGRVPDSGGWCDRLKAILKELDARLEGMPLQPTLELVAGGEAKRPPWQGAEIDWRVQEVERAHRSARREWKRRTTGVPGRDPAPLPPDVRRIIREAILVYDEGLLGEGEAARAEWKKKSRVRAAGIGIFYSAWHTGTFDNGMRPDGYGGPYLEADRPWRRRNGGHDPILKFSELYYREADLLETGT